MKEKIGDTYKIELLNKSHDKNNFDCGNDDLNSYLQKQASQDLKKMASTVFVIVDKKTESIHGFYTLAAAQIRLDKLPTQISSKLTKYKNQPAIRLGRLAVHKDFQGKKLGTALLFDAMYRITLQAEIGWIALIVDAKNKTAKKFYENHGFMSFDDDELHLYIMHSTIKKLFS